MSIDAIAEQFVNSLVVRPNAELIQMLVDYPALLHYRFGWRGEPDFISTTAIYHAAEFWTFDVLEYIVNAGVDVNTRNGDGGTALHLAAKCGNVRGAELLLRHGAEVNAKTVNYPPGYLGPYSEDAGGVTPLDLCVEDQHEMYDLLTAHGAEPGLLPALALGRVEVVRQLLANATNEQLLERVPDPNMLRVWADGCPDPDEMIELLERRGLID